MKKRSLLQRGFTLVEVLVSITLLLMVIVGPMQILTRSNHSTAFASQQMTAWFLAQEGLELAQQGRDEYFLQYFKDKNLYNSPWADFSTTTTTVLPAGKYQACFLPDGCDITLQGPGGAPFITACTSNACLLSLVNNKRASYQHTGGDGVYTRTIKMKETGLRREVIATSTVTWRTGSLIAGQKVETVTYLFNIYDLP